MNKSHKLLPSRKSLGGGHNSSLSLNRNNKSLRAPLIGASLFLSTFLLAFISGSLVLIPHPTSAETAGTTIEATINSVIAITTDATGGSLTIPITPTPTGTQSTSTVNINVSTNNLTGYTLSMNSSTNTTALTHTLAPTNTIASTTATYASPQALTNNTWGYSTATTPTTFSLIPPLDNSQTIKTTTEPNATSNTPVTFAAKITSDKASGTYANTIVFTATTNELPPPWAGIDPGTDVGPLQALTLDACPVERSTAFDARSGQVVFVRKIANTTAVVAGNPTGSLCWMETNLRYAGNGNWDRSYGWDDDRYATTGANDTTDNNNDDARPLTMTSTGYYFGGSQTNAYLVAGVTDAADTHSSATSTLNTAVKQDGGDTGVPEGTVYENNKTYYGYLYNWCAAMGGQANACNNTSTTGFNREISICPAGWRLPTGSASGEFGKLNAVDNSNQNNTDIGLRNNFLAVYSGHYPSSSLWSRGSDGYYWSSTGYGSTTAWGMWFYSSSAVPGTLSTVKSDGLAIRCVLAN